MGKEDINKRFERFHIVFCMNSAEMCHERLLTLENQNALKTSLRYLCTSWMSKKRL